MPPTQSKYSFHNFCEACKNNNCKCNAPKASKPKKVAKQHFTAEQQANLTSIMRSVYPTLFKAQQGASTSIAPYTSTNDFENTSFVQNQLVENNSSSHEVSTSISNAINDSTHSTAIDELNNNDSFDYSILDFDQHSILNPPQQHITQNFALQNCTPSSSQEHLTKDPQSITSSVSQQNSVDSLFAELSNFESFELGKYGLYLNQYESVVVELKQVFPTHYIVINPLQTQYIIGESIICDSLNILELPSAKMQEIKLPTHSHTLLSQPIVELPFPTLEQLGISSNTTSSRKIIFHTPFEPKSKSRIFFQPLNDPNHPLNFQLPNRITDVFIFPPNWSNLTVLEKTTHLLNEIGVENMHTLLDGSWRLNYINTKLQTINSPLVVRDKLMQCIEPSTHTRHFAAESFRELASIDKALSTGNLSMKISLLGNSNWSSWLHPGIEALKEKQQKSNDDEQVLNNSIVPRQYRNALTLLLRYLLYISQKSLRILKLLMSNTIISWSTLDKYLNTLIKDYNVGQGINNSSAFVQRIKHVVQIWYRMAKATEVKQQRCIVKIHLDGRPTSNKNCNVLFGMSPLLNTLSSQSPQIIAPIKIFGGEETYDNFYQELKLYFEDLQNHTKLGDSNIRLDFMLNVDLASLYTLHSSNTNIYHSDFCFCPYCNCRFSQRYDTTTVFESRRTFSILGTDFPTSHIQICTMHSIFRIIEGLFSNLIINDAAKVNVMQRLREHRISNKIYFKHNRYHIQKMRLSVAYQLATCWEQIFCPENIPDADKIFVKGSGKYLICYLIFKILLPLLAMNNNQLLQIFKNENAEGTFQLLLDMLCELWRSEFTSYPIYLHIIQKHLLSLMATHGSLLVYQLQGLEKHNNMEQIWIPRSTNNGRGRATNLQLLYKGLGVMESIVFCLEQQNSSCQILQKICNIILKSSAVVSQDEYFDAYNYFDATNEEKKIAKNNFLEKLAAYENSITDVKKLQQIAKSKHEIKLLEDSITHISTYLRSYGQRAPQVLDPIETMESTLCWIRRSDDEE